VLRSKDEVPFVLAASGPGKVTHTFRELSSGQAELTYSATVAGSYNLSVRSDFIC
jgi:hypothetical protein